MVRAHSTGSEDNGIHVGLSGEWPASRQRTQMVHGQKGWWWKANSARRKITAASQYKIFLNIEKPGVHEIMFSQRETVSNSTSSS